MQLLAFAPRDPSFINTHTQILKENFVSLAHTGNGFAGSPGVQDLKSLNMVVGMPTIHILSELHYSGLLPLPIHVCLLTADQTCYDQLLQGPAALASPPLQTVP